ncbi:MAG: hypothetical protein WBM09_04240 [Gallionella sp.]
MADSHKWNFFRAGGFDQVQLDNGSDLLALKDLDQKLWVALSCPTRGIEFDTRTLDLIDADADGRVRANDVLAAIAWAGGLLKDADSLVRGSDHLPLADIDDSSEEGKLVLVSARHILKSQGKSAATEISLADVADIDKLVTGLEFNGDGVVCARQIHDSGLRAKVEDIIKCNGSVADLSGEAGINQEICDKFFAEAAAYSAWQGQGGDDAAILVAGDKTPEAATAFNAVRDKVDDYFIRCQMAAYDMRAAVPLSRSVEDYQHLAAQSLSVKNSELADFPLATVEANKQLPLISGINPAWQGKVEALRDQVIMPLLGKRDTLTAAEWHSLCDRFSSYDAWQKAKPQNSVEQLGFARIRQILGGNDKTLIEELIIQDKAVEPEVKAMRSVERLLRYNRDLFSLVNNFVSFRHFYTGKDKAIFQVGSLYLDGRGCHLCVKIDDVNKHASFASTSAICLAYCDCVRDGGKEKMSIAAAFTAGDSDFLMVGRNGVFYDRQGRDWDATIVRIIDNPISIRQAFWSPYKKLVRAIGDQLQKFAASKATAIQGKMIKTVVDSGKAVAEAPPAPPKPPFDVAKFAGIFAAIGLAIGAIGGILAAFIGGLLGLKFWQIPLAVIGLMLLISCPSMLLAWFKLKQRNLGPILDANGWAINARVLINIPFGTSLTGLAKLPKDANRSMVDPFAEKRVVWPYYLMIAMAILVLIGLWYVGFFGHGRDMGN